MRSNYKNKDLDLYKMSTATASAANKTWIFKTMYSHCQCC